jgi:hypothetical protein
MSISSGPPQLPIQARLWNTDAKDEGSEPAKGESPWTLFVVAVLIFAGFVLFLYIFDLIL